MNQPPGHQQQPHQAPVNQAPGNPAAPFPPGPAHGLPHPEEGEDTQIGGFDPITDDFDRGQAIPGLPVAGGFGAGPAEPVAPTPAPAPAPAPAPKPAAAAPKKRSKAKKLLVTGTGGVLFLGAAVYGTGLMLNQSDVPRGTTVLGTDIGGDSRDQAVHQLDGTVGKIGQRPIQLKLGDQTVPLDPTTAGLGFDTTATVDGLTKHSYAPADVLSSLTGGTKAVPPVVHIDRAKLKAALDSLAANSAHGLKEGYVQFDEGGNATVVPGQGGQTLDSASAADQVAQAYQDRAAGKPDQPVTLATTNAAPKVSTQALQQAADSLGKQITSAPVTVWAGTRKFVFGRATAAKALTLAPDASGTIGPKWDLDQLGNQIGTTFDKLKFRKSDGTLAPITPQDVADGIASVYDKNTVAERTFKFRM
ncbi:peptidoglycan binding domain-containing protein [Kitasatospora sp. NPDC058965]|uniref:peptidoglycan binding domain-containing protein n=1 Tax=Kitasatospora sp. NPDC058965 TaxID=3346682 RepID=UPI003688C544